MNAAAILTAGILTALTVIVVDRTAIQYSDREGRSIIGP